MHSKVSTESKRLRGTLRPCREIPNQPNVAPGIPVMPTSLSKSARKYWPAIIAHMRSMCTITLSDEYAIASLCSALGDLTDARKELAKLGGGALTYQNALGTRVALPQMALIEAADNRVFRWVGKLGLSPSDRTRVSAIKDVKIDPDFGFLLN
jgi:P27 family predicted phage terminase small subunit